MAVEHHAANPAVAGLVQECRDKPPADLLPPDFGTYVEALQLDGSVAMGAVCHAPGGARINPSQEETARGPGVGPGEVAKLVLMSQKGWGTLRSPDEGEGPLEILSEEFADAGDVGLLRRLQDLDHGAAIV